MHITTTQGPRSKGKVTVHRGLNGLDEHLDLLQAFFREMQGATVESHNPDSLLDFAGCAHYFGVIMYDRLGKAEEEESKPPQESNAGSGSQSVFDASSVATPPPMSDMGSDTSSSVHEVETEGPEAVLPRHNGDMILRWQEASQDAMRVDHVQPHVVDGASNEGYHPSSLRSASVQEEEQLGDEPVVVVPNQGKKKHQPAETEKRVTRPPPPPPRRRRSPLPPLMPIVGIPIGIVYLWAPQSLSENPLHGGEYCMGFYISPEYRAHTQLPRVLHNTIEQAFDDASCHRLQLILVENKEKLYVLEMVSALGFRHEGTRRLAFYSPFYKEWRDVTYFGMLATEWAYDRYPSSNSVRLLTNTLFAEVLARHQKELDDLYELERRNGLKRTSSSETLRQSHVRDGSESPKRRRRSDDGSPIGSSSEASSSSEAFSSYNDSDSEWMEPWYAPSLQPSISSSTSSASSPSPSAASSDWSVIDHRSQGPLF
ncbi:hypothetical protein CPC08DRAFT_97133 [Agrocybe pediades]|nr:hypothetical protein CPC08DRAFT_97133 [Agrocybe pediades]